MKNVEISASPQKLELSFILILDTKIELNSNPYLNFISIPE